MMSKSEFNPELAGLNRAAPQRPLLAERQLGLRAFHAGNFGLAITCWTRLLARAPEMRLALAEAHFRAALRRSQVEAQLTHLQTALDFAPADPRYHYQLGLAFHRQGNLPAAIKQYRTLIKRGIPWTGVGLVLALATLEQQPHTNLTTLPGMNAAIAAALAPIQQLLEGHLPTLRDKTQCSKLATSLGLTRNLMPLERLWHGLGLMQQKNLRAREVLAETGYLASPLATAVRLYYQGVAEFEAGNFVAAWEIWQRVAQEETFNRAWLFQNLAALAFQQLKQFWQTGEIAQALELIAELLANPLNNLALNNLMLQILDQNAHLAAQNGVWEEAVTLWEQAWDLVNICPNLGSPAPLLHNLALAAEALEDWAKAAEMWLELLSLASPPSAPLASALVKEAENTQLWVQERAILCSKRAEKPGQAVAILRQAIRTAPQNLALRLQLAEFLLANEQEQTAFNELQRILQLDSQNVEARLKIAQIQSAQEDWFAAEQTLRSILAFQPRHVEGRQALAYLLLARGQRLSEAGKLYAAAKAFAEGQQLAPTDYAFALGLARIAAEQQKPEKARPLLEQALHLGAERPEVYAEVIECWAISAKSVEAQAILAQAETKFQLSFDFYLRLGLNLLDCALFQQPDSDFSLSENPFFTMATTVFERAIALNPSDSGLRQRIAAEVELLYPPLALRYAADGAKIAPGDFSDLLPLALSLR